MPAQEPARKELQRSGQYKRYSGRCYATDPKVWHVLPSVPLLPPLLRKGSFATNVDGQALLSPGCKPHTVLLATLPDWR